MGTSNGTHRDDNTLNRIPLWVLMSLAFSLILGTGIGGFVLGSKGQSAQSQKVTAESQRQTAENKAEQGVQLANENLKFCKDPAIVGILQESGYQYVCDLAVIVQTQAAKDGNTGKQGERGPGPSQAQINTAVDDYFRAHPLPEGKTPTVEQVAAAVGSYLKDNPPEPGRPPTADEIAMATAAYLAEHMEEFQGKEGERGRPPTADEVSAAVAAYCSEGDNCRGPQGPQGIGITGSDLRRDEQGVCTLYLRWENPANGDTGSFVVQVRDEMCSDAEVVPTTTETP